MVEDTKGVLRSRKQTKHWPKETKTNADLQNTTKSKD